MRYVIALATTLVLAAPALPASAQADKAQLDDRARFKAAQQLYDKKDFAGALTAFRAISSPNARLYAGRCLRELRKLPEAYEELTLTIREATARAASEPRYAETRDAASAERAQLVPKIGLVLLAVTDRPAGIAVTVGGRAVSEDRIGESIAVAPGSVVVEASAPGRESFRKEIAIGAGASEILAVNLPQAAARATGPENPPGSTDQPARPIGGVRIAGIVIAGIGIAGWGTFAAAGVMANRKYKSVYAACGGARCADPSFSSEISAGKTLDTAANVGLGVGIAGVAAGGLMILLGKPKDNQVTVNASPTGASVSFRASF